MENILNIHMVIQREKNFPKQLFHHTMVQVKTKSYPQRHTLLQGMEELQRKRMEVAM